MLDETCGDGLVISSTFREWFEKIMTGEFNLDNKPHMVTYMNLEVIICNLFLMMTAFNLRWNWRKTWCCSLNISKIFEKHWEWFKRTENETDMNC